ncbi:MAG: hypothetical protein RL660_1669 [Bacteroidota bacterium]|jgi:hypothetical protein
MENSYRFISDAEPSEADLEVIMSDAQISAMEKAEIAKQNLKRLFDEYFEKTKLKYGKIIFESDSKT